MAGSRQVRPDFYPPPAFRISLPFLAKTFREGQRTVFRVGGFEVSTRPTRHGSVRRQSQGQGRGGVNL